MKIIHHTLESKGRPHSAAASKLVLRMADFRPLPVRSSPHFQDTDLAGTIKEYKTHLESVSLILLHPPPALPSLVAALSNVFFRHDATAIPLLPRSTLHTPISTLSSGFSPFNRVGKDLAQGLVNATVVEDANGDAAVGAMLGMVIGDAFGAPLEFVPADGKAYKYEKEMKKKKKKRRVTYSTVLS